MASSDMSWTPSSSAKKRKYHEYCNTLVHPSQPHIPGAYPPSPASYPDFGRELYLGTLTIESRAIYQGVSAQSQTPMHLNDYIPQSLRHFMQKVADATTVAHLYSTHTLGLFAGPGGRAARCIQHSAGPVFEAIGDTAKRIKLTIFSEDIPSSATEPTTPTTPPSRRISSNMNVPPSASLRSQTSVLHYARETGLRKLRSTLQWVRDQQQQKEASQQMLQHNAPQSIDRTHNSGDLGNDNAYADASTPQDPLTMHAGIQTQPHHIVSTRADLEPPVLDHNAVVIDPDTSEDSHNLEALCGMDFDLDTHIALHLAEAEDSVNSSDLEGLDEADLVNFETKEDKRERLAQMYLAEAKASKMERQAELDKVRGVFPNPDLYRERLRMICDTAPSPRSPKKTVAFYDSPKTGNPVTLTKRFNHDASMTPPYRQHVRANNSALASALKRHDAPTIQVSGHDEHPSPASTASPSSDSDNIYTDTSISEPAVTTLSDDDTSNASSSPVASPDTVAGNFAGLGFSNRRSSHRRSDLEAIAQIKREHEAAIAAEEAAEIAREEAKRRAFEEAQRAEECTRLGIRRVPVGPVIEPLTPDWEYRVSQVMDTRLSSSASLATTSTGETLCRRDFGHVLPQPGVDPAMGWLNDTIITAYLQAVVDYAQKSRDVRRGDLPKVHAMNTFFYDNLAQRGYDSVKRWATKAKFGGKNLLKMEKILIPINKGGNHWVLVHVNPQAKKIEYFDSFHNRPGPVEGNIRSWLRNELGDAYVEAEWTLSQKEGPEQRNASDCGVFATTTAKMIVLGVDPMAFSAADMQTQRWRMLAELMNGGLIGDFAPNIIF
ncbi:MAG: hypothetical protein Q9224_002542 [Gallowayella concinna]